MEDSILLTIKKLNNIPEDYDAFDLDILVAINTVFVDLQMLGVGPTLGFSITDETAVWSDYLDDTITLANVKSYVGMRVRLMFDPPGTSYLINNFKEQIQKLEWLINTRREDLEWTPPPTS